MPVNMWGARPASRFAAFLVLAASMVSGYVAPSLSPPGGLDPSNTPMFVLFTHDDAVTSTTYELMTEVTGGQESLDGCPAVATMFTLVTGNDCESMVDLYNAGFEIADHTHSHVSLKGLSSDKLDYEILTARTELAECGIPESDIVGLRAPFLETDIAVRAKMYNNGFLYESSLIEPTTGASISQGQGDRVWPFEMDGGVTMDCEYFASTQECSSSESWPGMWQVPVWWLTKDGGSGTPYSMDYGDGDNAYEILKANFDAAYNGNRAPLPIFIHTPWLGDNVNDVKKFAKYALAKPNTYFVTIRQLLSWMKNPIAADQLTPEALGCGNAGGAGGNGTEVAPRTSIAAPLPTPTGEVDSEGEGKKGPVSGGSGSISDRLAALAGRRLLNRA